MPPPDLGLKNRTGRRGAGAGARCPRTPNAARAHTRPEDERGDHEYLFEQPVAYERENRRAEPKRCHGQAGDAGRSPSQDAIPGRGASDREAGERDQAARELLQCNHKREPEPPEAEEEGADRGGSAGA